MPTQQKFNLENQHYMSLDSITITYFCCEVDQLAINSFRRAIKTVEL